LIDPHSLLADDLLRLLITRGVRANPDIRHRLIYVDPARTDYVIPFNVLVPQAEHPYDIAAVVLEAFRRTWPECLKEAPHFSNVVTTALIVLYELHEVRIGQPDGDSAATKAKRRPPQPCRSGRSFRRRLCARSASGGRRARVSGEGRIAQAEQPFKCQFG
jgi:hypothetical protein